jgi:HSP20 family protein
MSIVKRNTLMFPALMNELFKPDWFGGTETQPDFQPAVNIKENEKDFEIALSVPGRSKEDFNIDVDKDVLVISSEVKVDDEIKEENYTRREFALNSFKRSFTLPETIHTEKIEASYDNGILSFVLPKKAEALPKPKRSIELS